jgi:hypothetical protein
VSRNDFRTCEVYLGAGSRYLSTLNSHGKRTLKSQADASFAVGKVSATIAVPRDMASRKLFTMCTCMTSHSACHYSVPMRYVETRVIKYHKQDRRVAETS